MGSGARLCPSCDAEVPAGTPACPSCGAISLPPNADPADVEDIARRLTSVIGVRYAVERPLGSGGMATVFLANDLRHHRAVAIKVLRPELSPVLGPDRFLREIEIAAQLNHPHIVPLYDSGEADGLLYYVMPYVEGASLRHRIAKEGGLPISDAVQIAREVADALASAHEYGVVHRDIKPENILLTHRHAIVADFGVARAIHATWATAPHTTGGVTLGTPHYMSPEQAESSPSVDHRTDIYALGCTLFEMLTGRPPYAGPGTLAILAQHLGEPVPRPSSLRQEVSPALDHVVECAMAKAPDARFASAAEMSATLAALLAPTGTTPAETQPPRPRRVGWVITLVVLLLVASVGVTKFVTRREPGSVAVPRVTLGVVVRPFDDRGPGLRDAADGLTESLTDQLLAIPALRPTSSAAAADLRGVSLDSLAVRFKPDRIVTGRLEPVAPDRMRVVVQIIDPKTLSALASDSLVVSRLMDGQSIAKVRVGRFIRGALWASLDEAQRRARVHDSSAWRMLVDADEHVRTARLAIQWRLDQRGFESLNLADSLLDAAYARDKDSDLIRIAQARIPERRAFFVEWLVQQMPVAPTDLPNPEQERRRALAILDPLLASRHGPAEAFELRGIVKRGLYRNYLADSLLTSAVSDHRAATELDMHRALGWVQLGAAQLDAGLFNDALFSIRRAFEEDVFQQSTSNLLRSQFDAALRAARFDVAEAACREWMALATPEQRLFDCELELWSRRRNDARTAHMALARRDSLASTGDSTTLTATLRTLWTAQILARARMTARSDDLAGSVIANPPRGWRTRVGEEQAYLRLLRGDPDSAVALIVGLRRDDPTISHRIFVLPWFQPLARHPGFTSLPGDAASKARP